MKLDGHIHMDNMKDSNFAEEQSKLLASMKSAGLAGGLVMSPDPLTSGSDLTIHERLEQVMKLTADSDYLFPFYWINPIAEDALKQVEIALKANVDGFKVICREAFPGDPRAMKVYKKIAEANKPMLFHSGILWDGTESSKYNRPAEFECLLGVPNLRFSLAHVSWPWCDECIAVYGKFQNPYAGSSSSCEMFIDITPGTPPIFREEVLKKLFFTGYDIKNNVVFGVDCIANTYDHIYANDWINRDMAIYEDLGLSTDKVLMDAIFRDNLLRFLGKSDLR